MGEPWIMLGRQPTGFTLSGPIDYAKTAWAESQICTVSLVDRQGNLGHSPT